MIRRLISTACASALLVTALLLSACGSDTVSDPGAPLAYAPADTPYVFGMIEPMPADLVDQFMQRGDRMGEMYATQFQQLRAEMASKDGDPQTLRIVDALGEEFRGKSLTQAMAMFGLDGHQRMALFGIGLVPVLRMELNDPNAPTALVTRMEQRIGEQLPHGEVDGQAFWKIALGETDAPLMLIVAVVDTQLVATLAPSTADAVTLKTLLGLQLPEYSLLESDRLATLQSRHHFLPMMLGEVDSQRLLDTLSAPATPLEKAFLTALDTEKPAIDEVCRADYGKLAALVPRIALGYTRIDAGRMTQVSVIETAPELARSLMTLRAAMPGMNALSDDLPMNFGYSMKLGAIPALAGEFSAAVNKAAFQCARLEWLNDAAAQAPKIGNNVGVYTAATVFSGLHLIIDQLQLGDEMKPELLSGILLIGSDNPQALLSLAKSYVPQLSSLEVKTDGSLQPLQLPAIPELDIELPAWVSAKDKVLALAFGEGADVRVTSRMQTDTDQQPLLIAGYSGKLYAQLMRQVMTLAAAEAKTDEERLQMQQTAAILDEVYGEWIRHFSMRIDIESRGLVLTQDIVTAP